MRIQLGEQENLEPNLAPLLDCIFLLLIFFLVATTFEKQNENEQIEQLNIALPDSSAALTPIALETSPLVLGVDRRGRFYLAGHRISVGDLHQTLKQQAEKDPSRRIRIDGDKETPFQHIVHLLDLCEFEGLNNIGVRTRP